MEHEFVCEECGLQKVIAGNPEQWEAYIYKTKNIQDIFPELSAADRELMLSGICGECFDKMFS
jgi:hypothetical protein